MKVYIYQNPSSGSTDIAFVDERNGKRYVAKPVELIFEECTFESKPTMKLSYIYSDALLKAFAAALAEQGIKTDNDHKIEGLLKATLYHLEDMRKLVFKKEVTNAPKT
jgi:hypothetical protein